jgi:hypothetical protein
VKAQNDARKSKASDTTATKISGTGKWQNRAGSEIKEQIKPP